MTTRECVPLPRGSFAIAHIEKSHWNLITGNHRYSRFYVVRVESADKTGRVKTFSDYPDGTPKRKDRFTTIYSFPDQYLAAAPKLYARQALDFVGYRDKEHLRLALVNVDARETVQA